jgi:hypothetical protein
MKGTAAQQKTVVRSSSFGSADTKVLIGPILCGGTMLASPEILSYCSWQTCLRSERKDAGNGLWGDYWMDNRKYFANIVTLRTFSKSRYRLPHKHLTQVHEPLCC